MSSRLAEPAPQADQPRPGTPLRGARGDRVRVCLVGPSLDILGGQAVQLQRLLRALNGIPSLAVDFLPVNPRLPGPFRALQRVKYVRTVATETAYLAGLTRAARRYDVLHAFSASYTSFLLAPVPALLAGRAAGVRTILNYRSGEAQDHFARSPLARRLAALASEIVVPSGYLVDVFGGFGLTARAIPNFVEVERIPHRHREVARPLFLSNRNLEPLYNVGCVLRAFARIQQRRPDAQLVVAGFGSERERLESLAGSLGLRAVTFVGRVSPEEMPGLYDRADVYLNSPDIDNMPNSIIEAYAAGLPVVTTDAGGIPYIVEQGRTGLMVPRDDDAALAEAALRVVEEPGLAAALSRAARETCLARYTWDAVKPHWERLYHDLAGRRQDGDGSSRRRTA